MNEYDVKRLGLIISVQAEIEGMKAENMQRKIEGNSMAFTYEDFISCKVQIENYAHAHNDNL